MTLNVIEKIGSMEFTLADVNQYEYIFQKAYPSNETIQASIRRNLQELRDLGLVKFDGNGRYKRLWKV